VGEGARRACDRCPSDDNSWELLIVINRVVDWFEQGGMLRIFPFIVTLAAYYAAPTPKRLIALLPMPDVPDCRLCSYSREP
jgi:hypothetical protein